MFLQYKLKCSQAYLPSPRPKKGNGKIKLASCSTTTYLSTKNEYYLYGLIFYQKHHIRLCFEFI